MHPISEAARVARSIMGERDGADVWRRFKAFAAQFGFHHLTVLRRHPDLPEQLSPSIVYIDAPAGFAEAFDRAGFFADLPFIHHALKQFEPFSATETRAMPLTAQQRAVLQHIGVSLDLKDGWTIPIVHNGETRGIVMLGGRDPDMSHLPRSILHLLAHCAFRRSEELTAGGSVKPRQALTPREVECLRWVAQGKTDLEIAVILAISPRTVRFHVENAKLKLRVATRVQAVTEALRLQAIAA